MADMSSGIAPDEPSVAEAKSGSAPRKNKKAYAIGATTLACALGGALAGAAAFSAAPGGAAHPGASADRLTTSSSRMPSVLGSLCSSHENTATAADTAIACRDYGVASYRALVAAARGQLTAPAPPTTVATGKRAGVKSSQAKAASSPSVTVPKTAVAGKATKKAPKLPLSSSKKSGETCVSTPKVPKGTPVSIPSTTLNVSLGNSGGVSVSTGSKGATVCAGKTQKKKAKHHKKKGHGSASTTTTTTTNPVQSVVSGVSGTVSGIAGGVGGL